MAAQWRHIEDGYRAPELLKRRPGGELTGWERSDYPGGPAQLVAWIGGTGSVQDPFAVELAVLDGARWPSLEEIRDALSLTLDGAIFAPLGPLLVAGDDQMQEGVVLLFVQGSGVPGSAAARRLELTAGSAQAPAGLPLNGAST